MMLLSDFYKLAASVVFFSVFINICVMSYIIPSHLTLCLLSCHFTNHRLLKNDDVVSTCVQIMTPRQMSCIWCTKAFKR